MKTYILETVSHSHTTPKEAIFYSTEKEFWQAVKDWAEKMTDSENLIASVTLDFCEKGGESSPNGTPEHRLIRSVTITNYEADPSEKPTSDSSLG